VWNSTVNLIFVLGVALFGAFSFLPIVKRIDKLGPFTSSLHLSRLLIAFSAWFISILCIAMRFSIETASNFSLAIAVAGVIYALCSIHKSKIEEAQIFLGIMFAWSLCSLAPQVISGGLPYSVSDIWTHTSYINRIISANDWKLVSVNLPDEMYPFQFAPVHSVMASVGFYANDAIATWNAFALLTSAFLCISATALMLKVRWLTSTNWLAIAIFNAGFILLFPLAPMIEGWAGYSIFASIWMFMLLGYMMSEDPGESRGRKKYLFMGVLILLIGVSHPIELLIVAFLGTSFLGIRRFRSKDSIQNLLFVVLTSLVIGLTSSRIINPSAQLVLVNSNSYSGYFPILINEILYIYTPYLILTAVFGGLYLWMFKNREPVILSVNSILLVLLLGPINPILFELYTKEMGENLIHRVFLAIPIFLLVPIFFTHFMKIPFANSLTNIKGFFALMLLVLSVFCISAHALNFLGLNGRLTYNRSDDESQLIIFPSLYKQIQQNQNLVFLSDTFTSAPIPTVSSNFIVTHRPWTEGPEVGRWNTAQLVMNSPGDQESRVQICKWGVSDILLNRAPLPEILNRQIKLAPWLISGFGGNDISTDDQFITLERVIDSVKWYKIDQEQCSRILSNNSM
jgi:hypothetical protein